MATNTLIKSMTALPSEKPEFVHLDDRYKCTLCHEVLQVPMMSHCGHRMCKRCFDDYMGPLTRRHCPADQEDCVDITESEMLPDFGTHREIQRLEVYCQNRAHGCKETMPWMKLQDHLSVCPYTLEDCVNKGFGCTVQVSKVRLTEHLEKECKFRTKACPHCGVRILETHVSDHIQNVCPSASIICPYKCGEQAIQRSELEAHKRVCRAKPKDCQYKDNGCTFSGTEDEVQQHQAQSINYHMQLMHSHMQSLEAENMMLKGRLKKLEENPKVVSKNEVHDIPPAVADIPKRQDGLEATLKNTQKIVAAINLTMKTVKDEVQTLKEGVESLKDNGRLSNIERELALLSVRVQEFSLKLQCVETASFDGVLIWKIRDYRKRKQEALNGKTLSLYSQPFYTGRYGYKGCGRVYLNGDGMGKGTHLSLFFVLLRGDFDALLPWPFRRKVVLTLIDQEGGKKNIVDSFRADPTSNSFKRPTSDMNIASGCPLFAPQSVVESSPYLKDDCIFLKIQIENLDQSS